jgi:[ribosomal protein S18]-alanine N-acetyltransferase
MIRPVHKQDIDFIRSYEGQMLGMHDSVKTIEDAIFNRKDARYFIFEDLEPKGYLGIHQDQYQIDMVTLYVPEPFRQQKVATQLLEYMIDYAKKEGIKKITLDVSSLNSNAISLYQKLGFETIHIRKNYYQDLSDAWVMIKELK